MAGDFTKLTIKELLRRGPTEAQRRITLPFGKYKGEKLVYLINYAPSYILWLTNTKFEIPEDIIRVAKYVCKRRGAICQYTATRPYWNYYAKNWW